MRKAYVVFLIIALCTNLKLKAQGDKDTTLESALELSIEELMNTKVSIATKSEQKVSTAPAVVTVLTSEIIKNSGARSIYDLLQFIPGFEFSKTRLGIVNAGVRGVKDPLTTARILILKDGVPYNDVMYGIGVALTKQFDINTIDRIEIIRGPGSALYGRNAFIGVVNIISKSAIDNSVNVAATLGNFNTYDISSSINLKKKDFNATFSFEKFKSDITGSKFNNGFGGESIWTIGVDDYFFNTKMNYKKITLDGMYSNIVNGASVGPFVTDSDKSTKIGIYSLQYDTDINDKIKLKAKVYGRNEFQVQNIEVFKPGHLAVYPQGAYVTPHFESYNYGGDLNLSLNILEKNQTMLGVQTDIYGLKNVGLKSSYDTYTSLPLTYVVNNDTIFRGENTQIKDDRGWIEGNGHDYSNIAFYVQNIYNPVKNLGFTFGGRYDIDSEFGGVFNPRLGLVWDINEKLILKLLYGQAYRAPNSQEQYRKTGFTRGNKDLMPETIRTTELSIDYNINKKINNRITLYYNLLKDIIFAQGITSGTPGSPYSNIGENTSWGIEYEYRMVLNNRFYMYLNYSYTNSKDKVHARDKLEEYIHRDIAPHKVNSGVNFRFFDDFNFNANFLYRSEREKYYAINKSTGDYILDENGNKTFLSENDIGNYFLLNSKLRILNILNHFELSIEVYNVLDTKYYDQDNEYALQPAREGRHFLLSVIYNLKNKSI